VNTILPESNDVTRASIEAAVGVYRDVGHVPSLMTRDHRDADVAAELAASGWRRLLRLPAMVLDDRLPDEPAPAGATIHHVETDDDRRRWIEGNLHGFAEDEGEEDALRSAFQALESLRADDVTSWWAEVDGRGAASASAWLDPGTGMAVVGWVGTDRDYRRRGLGRAVTLATVNAAFDLGATAVGLQASPMGLPVYERLGFRTVGGYAVWLPPSDTD
jgi:GNAT superfamily N-acetyltransferase